MLSDTLDKESEALPHESVESAFAFDLSSLLYNLQEQAINCQKCAIDKQYEIFDDSKSREDLFNFTKEIVE